jgi:hypothetical protein
VLEHHGTLCAIKTNKNFLMIAAVITGARNADNGSTPPSISSRLPKVGSRFIFLCYTFGKLRIANCEKHMFGTRAQRRRVDVNNKPDKQKRSAEWQRATNKGQRAMGR